MQPASRASSAAARAGLPFGVQPDADGETGYPLHKIYAKMRSLEDVGRVFNPAARYLKVRAPRVWLGGASVSRARVPPTPCRPHTLAAHFTAAPPPTPPTPAAAPARAR